MSQLMPKHKDHLTVGFVRCERVLQRAAAVLEPSDFDPQTERHYAIVYGVVRDFYLANRRMIPRDLLEGNLQQRMLGDPDWYNSQFLQQAIAELVNLAWVYPMDQYCPEVAIQLLQTMLDERKVARTLQRQTGQSIPEMITQMNAVYAKTRLVGVNAANPFDISAIETQNMTLIPREPTGFEPVDLVLGGGTREAEVIGILGPIGGGKTLTCLNTALATAYTIPPDSNEVVDYFTWEQPYEPDIRERLWIAATNIPKDRIEGRLPNHPDERRRMAPDVWQQIATQAERIKKLRVFDFSGGPEAGGWNGMEGVQAVIQQQLAGATASGKPERPRYIFADWVGDMARKHMASKGISDEKQLRGFIMMGIDMAKTLAKTYRSRIFLAHQLSATAGEKNATADLSQYDASDCRQFAAVCSSCLVIGRMDRVTRIFKLSNAKPSRTGGKPFIWCHNPPDTHQMVVSNHEWAWGTDQHDNACLVKADQRNPIGDASTLVYTSGSTFPTAPPPPTTMPAPPVRPDKDPQRG